MIFFILVVLDHVLSTCPKRSRSYFQFKPETANSFNTSLPRRPRLHVSLHSQQNVNEEMNIYMAYKKKLQRKTWHAHAMLSW